jgi:hypothetical protein
MGRADVFACRVLCTAFALSCIAASSAAQSRVIDAEAMQAKFAAAQAAAVRPGDEALGCDALQGELVAAANDPALQSYVAKSGAAAQKDLDAMKAGQSRMAAQTAITMFSSLVPGGALFGQSAAVAQAQAQQAQAAGHLQQRMQQAEEMMAILPQMLRGQRVIELAQARNCAWAREAAPR